MMPRRGGYALEFGLTLPIAMLLMLGFFDISWALYHLAVLDFAGHRGCRAGSLVDPGERDQFIGEVEQATNDRMMRTVEILTGSDCEDCTTRAWTEGDPPTRMLRCDVTMSVTALSGIAYRGMVLRSNQHARIEWQWEANP